MNLHSKSFTFPPELELASTHCASLLNYLTSRAGQADGECQYHLCISNSSYPSHALESHLAARHVPNMRRPDSLRLPLQLFQLLPPLVRPSPEDGLSKSSCCCKLCLCQGGNGAITLMLCSHAHRLTSFRFGAWGTHQRRSIARRP